jgi:hypothetical protein
LTPEYGQGFGERNLARMVRFAEVLPDREIVLGLSRQFGWSHFVEIIPLKTELHREFYAEMCRVERWSVRTLRDKIGGYFSHDARESFYTVTSLLYCLCGSMKANSISVYATLFQIITWRSACQSNA